MIILRIFCNIFLDQCHQIVTGVFQSICHHIGAHAAGIVRVTALVIFAFILRPGCNIIQGALQNVRLVIDPVVIFVVPALYPGIEPAYWSGGRRAEVFW